MAKTVRSCNLPIDVVRSISNLIGEFDDYVRFESVIRRIYPLGNTRQLQMLRTFPWLTIDVDENTKLLFFFSGKLFFPIWTPFSHRCEKVTRCFGSSFGWLVIGCWEKETCFLQLWLLNPCTNRRIQLPSYMTHHSCVDDTKVILTSSPESSRAVVVIKEHITYVSFCKLGAYVSFCRLGDEEWTPEDEFNETIMFFNGVVYGIDYHADTKVFTYVFSEDGTVSRSPFPVEDHEEFGKFDKEHWCTNSFLLDFDGKFLLVIEDIEEFEDTFWENETSMEVNLNFFNIFNFCVFWLNFEEHKWIRLTNLGDHMVLLSHGCSMSLDAAKFTQYGFRPNCIYFHKHRLEYGWQEFCLQNKTTVPFEVDFLTILPTPPIEEDEEDEEDDEEDEEEEEEAEDEEEGEEEEEDN